MMHFGKWIAVMSKVFARNRTSLVKMDERTICVTLISVLLFQPVLVNAQSLSASSGSPTSQPGIGAAPNGVPLIDIVTPNSRGLSHNKYDQFNIERQV